MRRKDDKITPSRARVAELVRQYGTQSAVAKLLGVSHQAVSARLKAFREEGDADGAWSRGKWPAPDDFVDQVARSCNLKCLQRYVGRSRAVVLRWEIETGTQVPRNRPCCCLEQLAHTQGGGHSVRMASQNETRKRTNLYLSAETREALDVVVCANAEKIERGTGREASWSSAVEWMAAKQAKAVK